MFGRIFETSVNPCWISRQGRIHVEEPRQDWEIEERSSSTRSKEDVEQSCVQRLAWNTSSVNRRRFFRFSFSSSCSSTHEGSVRTDWRDKVNRRDDISQGHGDGEFPSVFDHRQQFGSIERLFLVEESSWELSSTQRVSVDLDVRGEKIWRGHERRIPHRLLFLLQLAEKLSLLLLTQVGHVRRSDHRHSHWEDSARESERLEKQLSFGFHPIYSVAPFGLKRKRVTKRLPSMLDPIDVFHVDTDRRLSCHVFTFIPLRIDRESVEFIELMRIARWHQRISPLQFWSDRRDSENTTDSIHHSEQRRPSMCCSICKPNFSVWQTKSFKRSAINCVTRESDQLRRRLSAGMPCSPGWFFSGSQTLAREQRNPVMFAHWWKTSSILCSLEWAKSQREGFGVQLTLSTRMARRTKTNPIVQSTRLSLWTTSLSKTNVRTGELTLEVINKDLEDMVLIGVCIHLGSNSMERSPLDFEFFGRTVQVKDQKGPRWYNLGRIREESTQLEKKFSIFIAQSLDIPIEWLSLTMSKSMARTKKDPPDLKSSTVVRRARPSLPLTLSSMQILTRALALQADREKIGKKILPFTSQTSFHCLFRANCNVILDDCWENSSSRSVWSINMSIVSRYFSSKDSLSFFSNRSTSESLVISLVYWIGFVNHWILARSRSKVFILFWANGSMSKSLLVQSSAEWIQSDCFSHCSSTSLRAFSRRSPIEHVSFCSFSILPRTTISVFVNSVNKREDEEEQSSSSSIELATLLLEGRFVEHVNASIDIVRLLRSLTWPSRVLRSTWKVMFIFIVIDKRRRTFP